MRLLEVVLRLRTTAGILGNRIFHEYYRIIALPLISAGKSFSCNYRRDLLVFWYCSGIFLVPGLQRQLYTPCWVLIRCVKYNDINLMEYQITDVERRILAVLQGGFPRSRTPYKDAAEKAGISTEELLTILRDWKEQGKLRRIGAIVHHEKVGLSGGAMVAWRIDPEDVEQVGTTLAGFKEVSHAYERRTEENWPYNVYTMVHGTDAGNVDQTVRRMSEVCGVCDYRILTTERELKKVPPTYIQ